MAKEMEQHGLLEDYDQLEENLTPFERPRRSQRGWQSISWQKWLLLSSLCLNFLTFPLALLGVRDPSRAISNNCRSEYADLEPDAVSVDWSQNSVYASSNYSAADLAWDAINHDSGIVAVDKAWAAEKGLPMGSTFPWDSSKAIYFVNAFHGLHCLKNIYRSVMEFRRGVPQSLEYHHITHCLDQLRADVLCTADDTLRTTTPDMRPVTAEGQQRQCRDWDALRQWTYDHAGCYRYGNPEVEDFTPSQIPRMRFCPEGSPELERVREYFGKDADWKPAEEPVWSWFDEGLRP